MAEKLVFMQTEDNMVTFEREGGTTIIYPISLVPDSYKEGDIIEAIVHVEENFIEFLELNTHEMNLRRANITPKKSRLRDRAKRSTNHV